MLLREPVFKGVLRGFLGEPAQTRRILSLSDESIGSFLSRRFGSPVADNIVSAVLHGIYAGDIYQLSARSILPKLWLYEGQDRSIMYGFGKAWSENAQPVPFQDSTVMAELQEKLFDSEGKPLDGVERLQEIQKSSVFTFKRGIGQLADSLESALKANPNVQVRIGTRIDALSLIDDNPNPKVLLQYFLQPPLYL